MSCAPPQAGVGSRSAPAGEGERRQRRGSEGPVQPGGHLRTVARSQATTVRRNDDRGHRQPGCDGQRRRRLRCCEAARASSAPLPDALNGRSRLARAAGLELLPGLADVIGVADVVLSIVPPDQAEAVAAALAGARLLVDLNAVSPETARRISAARSTARSPARRRSEAGTTQDLPLGPAGGGGGGAAVRRCRGDRGRRRGRRRIGREDEHRLRVQGLDRVARRRRCAPPTTTTSSSTSCPISASCGRRGHRASPVGGEGRALRRGDARDQRLSVRRRARPRAVRGDGRVWAGIARTPLGGGRARGRGLRAAAGAAAPPAS